MPVARTRTPRERVLFPGSATRLILGLCVALGGPLLAAGLASLPLLRDFPAPPMILGIVLATLLGRLFCGLVASVWAALLINYYFVVPHGQLDLTDAASVASLGLFLLIAVVFSAVLARLDQAHGAQGALLDLERRNQRRLEGLVSVATALAGATTPNAVAGVVAELGPAVLDAARTCLYLEDDEDRSAASDVHRSPWWPTESPPAQEAMRSDAAVVVAGADELRRRYPDLEQTMPGGAWAWFPLHEEGQIRGLLFVEFHERRPYDETERSLLTALARAIQEAVGRARAYEQSEVARHDAERLQQVTAALSKAASPVEVAQETVRTGLEVLRAAGGSFMVPSDDELEPLAMEGYPPEIAERLTAVSLDADLPIVRAYRSATARIVGTLEEWRAGFPPMVRTVKDTGFIAITHHPLLVSSTVVGVISFAFDGQRAFSASERAFLDNLAAQSAQAFSRARSLEAEASARRQAEQVSRRLQRLHLVTDAALSTLSLEEMVPALLRRIQEILDADGATLLLLSRDGRWLIERDADPAHGPAKVEVGQGIAGRIAATGEPLVISNLREWETVRSWLQEQMRSLLGVPLRRAGKVIGVLHVTSRTEGRFEADDLHLMELMAGRIASALERAQLYGQRDHMASALQRSLLPGSLPQIPGLEAATLYQPYTPGDEVGGDFLDVFPQLERGCWGALVGDVSGKGPEAAAVMGLARHSVRSLARFQTRPSELLQTLNEVLLADPSIPDARFVTMCYARIHAGSGGSRITVSLAGHPPPLLAHADGHVEAVGTNGDLLGMFPSPEYHDVAVDLAPGERLVLYTDGLIEQRGIDLAVGMDRLAQALKASTGGSAEETVDAIRAAILDPREAREDDVAILVFRQRQGGPTSSLPGEGAPPRSS